MILEPKDKPTIIRVDRAFLDQHAPNRYRVQGYVRGYVVKQNRNVEKLREFLAKPKTTTEMAEYMGISFSYLKMLLNKIKAKNIIKGRSRKPGTWTL